MTAVVQAIDEVHTLIGAPPVVVGGVAVMCRLSTPYRATTDLDVVAGAAVADPSCCGRGHAGRTSSRAVADALR